MADPGKPPDLGPSENKAVVEQKTIVKDDSAGSISSDDKSSSTTSLKEKELHQADDDIHQDRDGQNVQGKADAGKEHEHRDKSFVSSKDENSDDFDSKGAIASSKKSSPLNEPNETSTDGRSSVDLQSTDKIKTPMSDNHDQQNDGTIEIAVTVGKECLDPVSEGLRVQEESSVDLPMVEKHVNSNVGSDHSMNLQQHSVEQSPNDMATAGMEVSKQSTSENVECKENKKKSYSASVAGDSKDTEIMECKASVSLLPVYVYHIFVQQKFMTYIRFTFAPVYLGI